MKRLFALLLAVIMLLSLPVTVFASEGTGSETAMEEKEVTINVGATVDDRGGNDMLVFVEWGDMSFEYVSNDYDNYTGKYRSYWSEINEGKISVKNYSNVGIDCAFSFTAAEGWDGSVSFAEAEEWLGNYTHKATWDASSDTYSLEAPTQEDLAAETPPFGVLTVKIGTDAPAIESECNIGTITVRITTAQ